MESEIVRFRTPCQSVSFDDLGETTIGEKVVLT